MQFLKQVQFNLMQEMLLSHSKSLTSAGNELRMEKGGASDGRGGDAAAEVVDELLG